MFFDFNSVVPTGLKKKMVAPPVPAINCRSILGCPFGTKISVPQW